MAMDDISRRARDAKKSKLPSQVVLVLQGGGALGAYQGGVYEALHEAGIEPDWVIGTSIGAINGAIIAGNRVERRLPSVRKLWALMKQERLGAKLWPSIGGWTSNLETVLRGIPGLISPNPSPVWGPACATGSTTGRILFDRRLTFDAVRTRRLRAPPIIVDETDHGSRQHPDRTDALLRRPRHDDRRRPCIGVVRFAPGISGNLHRRRALLGWRHLL